MKPRSSILRVVTAAATLLLWLTAPPTAPAGDADAGRIRPYEKNPRYWQYQGKPVLLLGATDDDNLFQWTGERLVHQHDNTRLAPAYRKPRPREAAAKPHDFFLTVPALNHDSLVLSYQRRFVDKLLSHSLPYDHVLYCISNEIHPQYPPDWGWYWAAYLRERASAAGYRIEVSEMYWEPNLAAEQHRASLDRTDVYSFFEGSQNSATLDPEAHWENLQSTYQRLKSHPRPINHTKTYGADSGASWTGDTRNAQEQFWRNVLGGAASSRFHRPPSGLGLSQAARPHVKSLRQLADALNVFACEPRNDLRSEREPNEAYCLAEPGRQYAVYFPNGGAVKLDVSAAPGPQQIRWLNISQSEWQPPQTANGGATLNLKSPGTGHWAVLVTK